VTPSTHNNIAAAKSRLMFALCALFTATILALLIVAIASTIWIGAHSLRWDFFRLDPIPAGVDHSPGGMRSALLGTAILVALASLLAIPIGLLTGIYLAEYDTRSSLATLVRFVCDVLAGVPSIVVGILGYELIVRPLGNFNAWAGAAALAFIMIPIIARTTEEMLRLVPASYREASMALGAGKAKTIFQIVIPAAAGTVATGIMLAIARAAGETAPLLFTTLLSHSLNPNQPFPSLTVQSFDYATGPDRPQQSLAWAGILVLVSLIFVLNLTVRLATRARRYSFSNT
jgi:phosphate transport system permease protein